MRNLLASHLPAVRRFLSVTPRAAVVWLCALALALTTSVGPFPATPAKADVFDDVMSAMKIIDSAAPGALPFSADDLQQYRDLITGCGAASGVDDVVACVEAALKTPIAQDQGVPSWLPLLIEVYFDIAHHDYWGLLQDAGEAVACAAAQILTDGFDVCGAIQELVAAAQAVASAAEDVVNFLSDLGGDLADFAHDVICFLGGCSSPPAPTGQSEAQKYCSTHGGVASLLSATNKPDDFSVSCNDGSQCRVKPGEAPKCQTGEQKAASQQKAKAINALDFATKLPAWGKDFDDRWLPKCLDDQCRIAVKLVRLNTVLTGQQEHDADPMYPYVFMTLVFQKADVTAANLVAESVKRFNANTTAKASAGWEQLAVAVWSKQCADSECLAEIKALAAEMAKAAIARQKAEPDESSLHVQGEIGKIYGPKFKKAVDDSKVRTDPKALPDQKLLAMGCAHFLGRANEYLCLAGKEAGYQQCLTYQEQGVAKRCQKP